MKEIKEIIKTLKKALENAHLIENDIIEVIFDSNDLEWLLQALEEQPFCDSCEWSSDSEGMGNGLYCDNKESTLGEMSIIDKTTSCIHHSGRKELTEQQKLFSQITEKDIEEFIEYIKKRKEIK